MIRRETINADLLPALKGKASLQGFTSSPYLFENTSAIFTVAKKARNPPHLRNGILSMGLGLTLILTKGVRYPS